MNEIPPPEGKGEALIIPSGWRKCTVRGLNVDNPVEFIAGLAMKLGTVVQFCGDVFEISRGSGMDEAFESFVRELEKASRTSQHDVRITFDETAVDRLRAICGEVSSWLRKALHLNA